MLIQDTKEYDIVIQCLLKHDTFMEYKDDIPKYGDYHSKPVFYGFWYQAFPWLIGVQDV